MLDVHLEEHGTNLNRSFMAVFDWRVCRESRCHALLCTVGMAVVRSDSADKPLSWRAVAAMANTSN